jgi:hypothetical protein
MNEGMPVMSWKLIAATCVLLAALGCGSDTAATPTTTSTPEPTPTPSIELPAGSVPTAWIDVSRLVFREDSGLEAVLSNLSANQDFLNYLAINDLTSIAEDAGVTPPEPSADAAAGLSYAMDMFTNYDTSTVPFSGELPTLADVFWLEMSQLPYWGFDWRDYGVTAVSRARGDNPGSLSGEYDVITGSFDFEQITASIAACEECVEPTTGTLLEVPYLRWEGNSVEERNSPPFFRLGFPGHYVTVQDGVLYTAWNEESLQVALQAASGERGTLADNADVVSMVRAIDALGANGALISYASFALEDLYTSFGNRDELVEAAETADLLLPFTAVASGAGASGDERFTALVLLNEDAATAEENVTRLMDRIQNGMADANSAWADRIDRVEIAINGNLIVARLYHSVTGLSFLAQQPNAAPILTISE